MSREDNGLTYLGRYKYARQLKMGGYSLYEGAWSDRGEDNTAGLEVVRDSNGKPLRFDTLEDVQSHVGR